MKPDSTVLDMEQVTSPIVAQSTMSVGLHDMSADRKKTSNVW